MFERATLQDLIRVFLDPQGLNAQQQRRVRAHLLSCRTEALGGVSATNVGPSSCAIAAVATATVHSARGGPPSPGVSATETASCQWPTFI